MEEQKREQLRKAIKILLKEWIISDVPLEDLIADYIDKNYYKKPNTNRPD